MKYFLLFTIGGLLTQATAFCQSPSDLTIVSCFYQGRANNCASVALIKAAMLKYGYKNMFQTNLVGSGYQVTLKNGTALAILAVDLDQAKAQGKFAIKTIPELGTAEDSVLFYAYLAYAAIAKYISVNGYWGAVEAGSPHLTGYSSFKSALRFISRKSYATDYCYRLLGMSVKDPTVPEFKDPAVIASETGVILYSPDHAVVAYKGQLDCHGNWVAVSTDEVCGNMFKWYLILK
jgi:hypothetical protein